MYFCNVFRVHLYGFFYRTRIFSERHIAGHVYLCCSSITDDTHSIKLDTLENALLAMLPVEVVPHEGSGWSYIYHGLADINRSW